MAGTGGAVAESTSGLAGEYIAKARVRAWKRLVTVAPKKAQQGWYREYRQTWDAGETFV